MPHPRHHLSPKRMPSKIFSRCSGRRLHRRLGLKYKHLLLNFSLSHFHHSAMRLLVPHLLQIGMLAMTGTVRFHLCNRMSGALIRLLNSHLCLIPEAIYGEGPWVIPRVRVLASSGHQRRQATRKPTRRMYLGTFGAVSSRCLLALSALFCW